MSIIKLLLFRDQQHATFPYQSNMKITTTANQLPGRRLDSILPHIRSFFTSGPTIIGVNVLFLGGFLALLFFNQGSGPELVSAAIPSLAPNTATSKSDIQEPLPTKTPFLPSPLTPTPTISPTPTSSPTPTFTPTITLPEESRINGIKGHPQSMPLSCESRSAVDWAAYFGKSINEYKFFDGLPVHDNPNKGFVGSVYGSWGQIPPYPYGVHAKPIAQRLREYGLNAQAVRDMSYKELKEEIAAGRPVIVWVVGHVGRGTPIPYTASGGAKTTVARFEHTVIVIGYTEHKVTVLDGAKVYSRYEKEFLKSWNVLQNLAVIWID
ncbi:MAG: C39 family peptidase, partial [Anaerolineales bacterium]|nr:C39 family peptidase [Anaerolineales bacterium]